MLHFRSSVLTLYEVSGDVEVVDVGRDRVLNVSHMESYYLFNYSNKE